MDRGSSKRVGLSGSHEKKRFGIQCSWRLWGEPNQDGWMSGGYRTIIFYQRGERAVFAYGFAKSDRANIAAEEVTQFKEAALHVLRLSGRQIEELIMNGDFVEVNNEQEISK